ncbi:MAG: 2,5-diamino-6-(ribosylamino)-4(3H)-pyrimidinone 5'-phosphate reductase [Halobacteriota archaeon]
MYVLVNAAMSADGKLSSHCREQIEISGPEDFDRVDQIRATVDGVVVGVGTVLADDPKLTIDDETRRSERLEDGRSANPARVVADSRARTPADARLLDDEAQTYVLVSAVAPESRIDRLRRAGATVLVAGVDRVDLGAGFDELRSHGLDRVLVEGGGEVIFSLFEDELVDELRVYVGSMLIGGRDAPTLADGDGFAAAFPTLSLDRVDRLDDGVLLEYTVEGR